MFFVENDEAEVGLGGEEGASRAYGHAEFAFVDAPPFVELLAGFEAAVEDGDLAREAGTEALHGLGGEGDLGDEDYAPPPELQAALQSTEIYLGLAAAGDATEEERLSLAARRRVVQGFFNRGPDALLVGGEVGGGGLLVVPGWRGGHA